MILARFRWASHLVLHTCDHFATSSKHTDIQYNFALSIVPLRSVAINKFSVLAGTPDTETLTVLDHDQENGRGRHANERSRDEAFLEAQGGEPWGNTMQRISGEQFR